MQSYTAHGVIASPASAYRTATCRGGPRAHIDPDCGAAVGRRANRGQLPRLRRALPLCYLAAVDKHLRWQLGEFDHLRIKENNAAHNNIGTYTCVYTMHNTGQEHMAAVTWQPRPPAHITVRLNAALNYRYYRKFMKIMVLNAPELNAMRLRFRVEISQ